MKEPLGPANFTKYLDTYSLQIYQLPHRSLCYSIIFQTCISSLVNMTSMNNQQEYDQYEHELREHDRQEQIKEDLQNQIEQICQDLENFQSVLETDAETREAVSCLPSIGILLRICKDDLNDISDSDFDKLQKLFNEIKVASSEMINKSKKDFDNSDYVEFVVKSSGELWKKTDNTAEVCKQLNPTRVS